jgi:hypothetical protein
MSRLLAPDVFSTTAIRDLFDVSTHLLQLKLHGNELSSPPMLPYSRKATHLLMT